MAKTFEKSFKKLPRLTQIILLFIPVVNWVTEFLVRWSHALRKKTLLKYIIAILATLPSGIVVGWLDALWCLLFKRLFLCN